MLPKTPRTSRSAEASTAAVASTGPPTAAVQATRPFRSTLVTVPVVVATTTRRRSWSTTGEEYTGPSSRRCQYCLARSRP